MNRSYAYFYNYIGEHVLYPPAFPKKVTVGGGTFANTVKYVALGDSLTAGTGTKDFNESFPILVGNNLVKVGVKVEIIKLSVPGAGVKQVLTEQVPKAILERPDVITLLVGVNDIHNLVSTEDFKKDFSQVMKQLGVLNSAKIIVVNIPYLGSDRILMPPFNMVLDVRTKQFNKIIKNEAQGKNVRYIDLYSQTMGLFRKDNSLYSEDQFHPSASGYFHFAKAINAD